MQTYNKFVFKHACIKEVNFTIEKKTKKLIKHLTIVIKSNHLQFVIFCDVERYIFFI